jgi:AmmeMemoRadiSam system protein A/AmmeMemoRadiSam system protein B
MPAGIVYGCVVPHPPVLLPEIGGDMARDVEPTVDALREVGRAIAAYEPETLVVISPHGPLQNDAMSIGLADRAEGDFRDFRAPQVALTVPCDVELASSIQETCRRVVLDVQPVDGLTGSDSPAVYRLDHGAAVPLHFLLPLLPPVKVVLLGFSSQPRSTHTAFGQRIREACEAAGRRVAFVASGDLSHRLSAAGPYGYDPQGQVFDEEIVAALAAPDWGRIRGLPQLLIDRAGVCGYLSILTLAGAMGSDVESRVLSYQGPFGVGYAVAEIEPKSSMASRPKRERATSAGVRLTAATVKPDSISLSPAAAQNSELGGALLALARQALEAHVLSGTRIEPPAIAALAAKQSCFVSLYANGQLRGCVGSVIASRASLAHEIVENAIRAGRRDYRFMPVVAAELAGLAYSVDILSPLEAAKLSDMDPAVYGMVVMQGTKVGVLLPAIPQVTDVAFQLQVCCEKAGIVDQQAVDLYRFTVQRYAEPGAGH